MTIQFRPVNRDNHSEMRFIAEKDSQVPLQYDPYFTWSEKSIDHRLEYFKRINPDDFFEVAVQENQIIGFHVIHKIPYPPDLQAGIIATLWVDPSLRGQGIGSQLKARGEAWAKSAKLTFLETGVHPTNTTMLEMNKKSGFTIVQYSLRKKL